MTELQEKIIKLFREQTTYNNPKWGFSAMGFREVAKILNKDPIGIYRSMDSLLNKGIFFQSTGKDQWDDTTFFMKNSYIKEQ